MIPADISCADISDALSSLGIQSFIPNITLKTAGLPVRTRICGPAHTIEYCLSSSTSSPKISPDAPHQIDCAPKDSILVIKSPSIALNAVFGGLMMNRSIHLGVQGAVIEGRVRDIVEISDSKFPVYATGLSTIGAAPFCRVSKIMEPVELGSDSIAPIIVNNGDIIVADADGVVCIPFSLVDQVVEVCLKLKKVDENIGTALTQGMDIKTAFKKYRK